MSLAHCHKDVLTQLVAAQPGLSDYRDDLARAFRLSDFVARVANRYTEQFARDALHLLKSPKNLTISHGVSKVSFESFQSIEELNAWLRTTRNQIMAIIAMANLLDYHDVRKSMSEVSNVADQLIRLAYQWHYAALCKRYGRPSSQQHMQIMAMGKLGGQELNFSSDIDLIFTYPENGMTDHPTKPVENQQFFTRLAQKLIASLDTIDQHGRVFRVDMRLRPMGDSGSLVISYSALEHYLLEQGREWERFAMQKMRVINVNRNTDELYKLIRPFVYRKYLDYTTIESIREMKTLIEQEVRRRQLRHNIKLGQGGIREIEFYVQSLQLINAGRRTACQKTNLLDAIATLIKENCLQPAIGQQLSECYLHLRQIEHYLQIFGDEQTQFLPDNQKDQARLCELTRTQSFDQCLELIESTMSQVNSIFKSLIDAEQKDTSDVDQAFVDLWSLSLSNEEKCNLLQAYVTDDLRQYVADAIDAFKTRIHRAKASSRAKKSLDQLMPCLLAEIVLLDSSDAVSFKHRIDGVLSIVATVIGRPSYLDLLIQCPDVRKRLAVLCAASPWVANEFELYPVLLDELLHPNYLNSQAISLAEFRQQCTSDLRQYLLRIPEDDVEQQMDALRQFKQAYQLRVAAADISETIPINQVSDRLTILAEVMLEQVIEMAWQQCVEKFGRLAPINDRKLAVIGYGKFGGWELSYGSDLDLVFLYDANLNDYTDDSGQRKPISVQAFYIKLVQRVSHLCNTQTYHGKLYEIDLRLRPSGNSGLLISHIDAFADYQLHQAWTWEHQALVRSRPVYGNPQVTEKFIDIRKQCLQKSRQQNELKQAILDMRQKMRDHLDKSEDHLLDIKQCKGGVVDIEFCVQYWCLLYAHEFPQIQRWSDNLRILDSLAQTRIISNITCETLQQSYLWLRHKGHRLQLAEQSLLADTEEVRRILGKVIETSPLLTPE